MNRIIKSTALAGLLLVGFCAPLLAQRLEQKAPSSSGTADCDQIRQTRVPFEISGEFVFGSQRQQRLMQVYRSDSGHATVYSKIGNAVSKTLMWHGHVLQTADQSNSQVVKYEYLGADLAKPWKDGDQFTMRITSPSGKIMDTRMTYRINGIGMISVGPCRFTTEKRSYESLQAGGGQQTIAQSEFSSELMVAVATKTRIVRNDGTAITSSVGVMDSIRTHFAPLAAAGPPQGH